MREPQGSVVISLAKLYIKHHTQKGSWEVD